MGMLAALKLAEDFMSGFEGDREQEGLAEKLATIRAEITKAETGVGSTDNAVALLRATRANFFDGEDRSGVTF
jgi:hypothetical protein